ncbi:hypothetical protein LEP1GSC188_3029 [Leptospira weilii serovar Topaz str. LT2116]|uniref:Uncharacterized protein n=1 Tax=Leptospira weilii serovar Topaz str. LT2116 TaxID=1088540 RepID=M3H2H0_9LEPT|nr:hypothetical protein LEP1GSC188_3029 [Leptospira weilii serovar Topaz str. LT2116]
MIKKNAKKDLLLRLVRHIRTCPKTYLRDILNNMSSAVENEKEFSKSMRPTFRIYS